MEGRVSTRWLGSARTSSLKIYFPDAYSYFAAALRWIPQTLIELHSVCSDAGGDLLTTLRNEIGTWDRGPGTLNSRLVLIVVFPKVRTDASPIENYETWVYVSNDTIQGIGQALGIWEMTNGVAGHIIGGAVNQEALTKLGIYPLYPTYALGRDGAATMNGVAPDMTRLTAVGLGALGSQVVTLLARSAYVLSDKLRHTRRAARTMMLSERWGPISFAN